MSKQNNKVNKKNNQIKANEVRVIDNNNLNLGILKLKEAIELAESVNLDLVEIQPNIKPPICKIIDFGKFRYKKSKKEKANKKKTKDLKEVRLGRTINIEEHDLNVRISQIKKFLKSGHSVLVVQNLKKREKRELGLERLNEISKCLDNISKVKKEPSIQKFNVSMILCPLK